ncbi:MULTISPECIES: hypothetical protein [Nitrospirillum]|nr:hypothetical protein [Nitrospirillum amazonense]MDG3443325.1 hypothetical protein [Nitrospirillum amazonense]MEC4589570.1 hypothetical protein [Nitrospirillum amazonense]TWB27617.1 hypothetical protein FBZ88_10676 [Nitrospirillum amazonense]TWB38916.1 hypothetical protein FBZ91_106245 [Nitrospirillum amazonense]TWB82535.1 hypothetical protein FBZ87_101239 [Nitrospirillum amazonense]
MELGWLMLLMIGLLAALLFRQWRELTVRRLELSRQLEKREALVAQFRQEIDGTSGELEQITNTMDTVTATLEELREELDNLDKERKALRERRLQPLVLLDRQTLNAQHFWELTISNPDFGETATARMAPSDYVDDWVSGRVYLVGADTAEEATKRATQRFSASMGYRVLGAVAFRRR